MARKYTTKNEISVVFSEEKGKYNILYSTNRKQRKENVTIYVNCKDGTARITPTQIFKLKNIEGKLK